MLDNERPSRLTLLVTVASSNKSNNMNQENWSSQNQFSLNQYALVQARSLHEWWRALHWCLQNFHFETVTVFTWHHCLTTCLHQTLCSQAFLIKSSFSTVASEDICINPRGLSTVKIVLKISVTFLNQHFPEISLKQYGSFRYCKNCKSDNMFE